ncbi:MAG: anti-sigma factor family protein, partial [bacterium]
MKCSQVEIIISAQIDGEVTASEWRKAEKHISGCQHCAETITLFEHGTAFVKKELQSVEPSHNLWAGIAGQIERQKKLPWLDRLNGFAERFVLRPTPKIRYALAGFTAATVLFVAILLVQQFMAAPGVIETANVPSEQTKTDALLFADLPKEQRRQLMRQVAVVQDLQDYFQQAGLLLMEIKNNDSEKNANEIENIRRTSKKLLDETMFVKKELRQPDMALVRQVVTQIETALFDLANIKDLSSNEDFELIKASIMKKDLLIKIEIIDLKQLEKPGGGDTFP